MARKRRVDVEERIDALLDHLPPEILERGGWPAQLPDDAAAPDVVADAERRAAGEDAQPAGEG